MESKAGYKHIASMLDRLPDDVLREILSYDSTYKERFSKEVLPQMRRFFTAMCELILLQHVPDTRITPCLRSFSKHSKKADLISVARYLGIVLPPRRCTKWRISLLLLGSVTGRGV